MPKKITETEMLDALAERASRGMLQVQGEKHMLSIGWFTKRPREKLRKALRRLVRQDRRIAENRKKEKAK